MTNEQLIQTAKEAMRNDTVLNKGMVELLCNALVAVTEQRDALVLEMSIVKNDYATIPEVKRIGWPNTPNFDAAIASLRAEGVEIAISHIIEKFNGTGIGVPVMALEHLARQLRESKGECNRE